jgi:predicted transcriptional regulator
MINPKTLNITPEILSLIAEIDEFKGAWRALGTLAPERLASLRRVATIESIGLQILEHIKEHGQTTIGEMTKLTGISKNTLKEHFRLMIKRNLLTCMVRDAGRGIH